MGKRMSRLRADDPAEREIAVEEMTHFLDDDTRLGDLMRGERATLGKSLLDVQRELRIRASHVAAIENCDITAFDTPSFVAGYVRSYARYLGMDPDWAYRRFCLESGFQPTHGMATAAAGPKPVRRPSDPAEALANPHALFIPQEESFWSSVEPRALGSVLVLVVLVGGLIYGGWSVLQEVQRVTLMPGDDAPGVVAALDPVEGAALPEPALDSTDTAALVQSLPQPQILDRLYRPQILEAPLLTARDGPIAAIDPGLTVSDPEPVQQALAEAIQGPPSPAQAMDYGPQIDSEQLQVRTLAGDAPEFELLAARPAWVRVTSADGTVLLEKIMDAGERFVLPNLEEPPVLRTGNSGAVYFAVSGRTYGPVAPGPQVVRNVKLSAESVTKSYAFADLDADPELAQIIALARADTGASVSGQTAAD